MIHCQALLNQEASPADGPMSNKTPNLNVRLAPARELHDRQAEVFGVLWMLATLLDGSASLRVTLAVEAEARNALDRSWLRIGTVGSIRANAVRLLPKSPQIRRSHLTSAIDLRIYRSTWPTATIPPEGWAAKESVFLRSRSVFAFRRTKSNASP
jgi:hypothetical protein